MPDYRKCDKPAVGLLNQILSINALLSGGLLCVSAYILQEHSRFH